jgi:hypothetical protein
MKENHETRFQQRKGHPVLVVDRHIRVRQRDFPLLLSRIK